MYCRSSNCFQHRRGAPRQLPTGQWGRTARPAGQHKAGQQAPTDCRVGEVHAILYGQGNYESTVEARACRLRIYCRWWIKKDTVKYNKKAHTAARYLVGMEDDRTENMEEEGDHSQEEEVEAEPPASSQAKPQKKKPGRKPGGGTASDQGEGGNYPCLCCGENCRKNQQSVRCVMCALWAHKTCIKMTDAAFKTLEIQQKETGTAYWVCRPCQSFAQRIQHQLGENNKRHEETERRVLENSQNINSHTQELEKLKEEMKKLTERMDRGTENRDEILYGEMQEREVRRLNLVLHGVVEPPETVRTARDRQELDRTKCEDIFTNMKARTKKEDIKFCRRIGEKRAEPRPLVIGLENEEEKRHLLFKARNLVGTKYQDISVVPDLTRKQREVEDNLRKEAEARNKNLTREDKEANLRWIVVGRRGEKRLVKGVERQDRDRIQFRNAGLRGGDEWWGTGPGGGGRRVPAVEQPPVRDITQTGARPRTANGTANGPANGPGMATNMGQVQPWTGQVWAGGMGGQQGGPGWAGGQTGGPGLQQQGGMAMGAIQMGGGWMGPGMYGAMAPHGGPTGMHGGQGQGGYMNDGAWQQLNGRPGDQYRQETSTTNNQMDSGNTSGETGRGRLGSKRTREQEQDQDTEPARNRTRH